LLFNDTAPTVLSTLSLHDALPILDARVLGLEPVRQRDGVLHLRVRHDRDDERLPTGAERTGTRTPRGGQERGQQNRQARQHTPPDRKSTRLNSSHVKISYAVFCLK